MASQKKKVDNRMLIGICGLLVAALMIVGFKYAMLRSGWRSYSGETQQNILGFTRRNAEDQAKVIAMGGMYKMNGRELYRNPKELQNYIVTIGTGLKHSIVVVDRNSTILADTNASMLGKKYTADTENEVQKTISDGETRTFTETVSGKGVQQTVIALKDTSGSTIGAIIFSTETIK